MNYKFDIRFKFSLFIISLTVFLLVSLSGFVFVNSRNLIIENSKEELESYSEIIKTGIEKEIFGSVLELRLLNSQFYNDFIFLPQFIKKSTQKYIQVELWNIEKQEKYVIKPSIVYGGDIEVSIDTVVFDILPKFFDTHEPYTIHEYNISKGSRALQISMVPSENTPYYLNAMLALDYLINENVRFLSKNEEINTLLVSDRGTIIFSKNLQDINRNIFSCYSISNEDFYSFEKYINNNLLYQPINLIDPGLIILVQKNLSKELKNNREVIKNIALFVGIILIGVLVIVGIIAKRVSNSLNNITNVAQKVSEGDFSGKIKFQRKDELGALIDTFNQMVDKLDFTFHELDSSNFQLKENIDELKRTKNQLSQAEKLALIGETVSKISHEIQNKIGGISIWIQNLELYQNSDETVKLYIGEMKEALNSFLDMLNNFKMFYRQQDLNFKNSNIYNLMMQTLNFYENELKNREVDLDIDFKNKDIELSIDSLKVEEVFTNIFINSLYFAPKNSIIRIDGQAIEEKYIIKIINFGPSIPKESLGKLFQPFYSTKTGGSGLGLAISQNIIKAHKGEIAIENLSDGGVCTTIKLPGN